jgi:hypothetical protein
MSRSALFAFVSALIVVVSVVLGCRRSGDRARLEPTTTAEPPATGEGTGEPHEPNDEPWTPRPVGGGPGAVDEVPAPAPAPKTAPPRAKPSASAPPPATPAPPVWPIPSITFPDGGLSLPPWPWGAADAG